MAIIKYHSGAELDAERGAWARLCDMKRSTSVRLALPALQAGQLDRRYNVLSFAAYRGRM